MRKRGCAAWALCVIGLAALYAFTGTGASALLLAAAVILPPSQIMLAALAAPYVTATLKMPVAIQKGRPATGSIVIRNGSVIPVVKARVLVEVVNQLTRERRVFEFSSPVMPLSAAEMPFAFNSAHCGQLMFYRRGVTVCDSLGLYYPKSREIEPPPFRRVVGPELFSSNVFLSPWEAPSSDDAERYLDKKGKDRTEIFQIRDYGEGDEQKQILWKLTARFGRLIVSDPAEPVAQNLLVFWDGGNLPEGAPPSVPDALAEALFTVCVSLAESGTPFTIAWQRGDGAGADGINLKDITCLSDVFDVTADLLSLETRGGDAHANAFAAIFGDCCEWARIAYFSGRVPPMAANMPRNVSAFICVADQEGQSAPRGASGKKGPHGASGAFGAKTVFTPDDYQSVLADVVI